jgi:hypothetical protein
MRVEGVDKACPALTLKPVIHSYAVDDVSAAAFQLGDRLID